MSGPDIVKTEENNENCLKVGDCGRNFNQIPDLYSDGGDGDNNSRCVELQWLEHSCLFICIYLHVFCI